VSSLIDAAGAVLGPGAATGPGTLAALRDDPRVVLVLDAGGTSFRFNAVAGGRALLDAPHTVASAADDLATSLGRITDGFAAVHAATGRRAVAVSIAFPGPADYAGGIIGDLPNLTGFRGGVPLGPMLAAQLGLPTFINNDGALFAYGEAIGGLLPWVNDQLAAAGRTQRYRNLLGVTIGTGFGGGLVVHDRLVLGDNSAAGQIWMTRHRDERPRITEEGVSIRAVRRGYAAAAGLALDQVPEPRVIAEIAAGRAAGDARAAAEAFRRLGQVAGDAIGNALALIDGLVVLGGGLSGAAALFVPALLDELNSELETSSGPVRRLPFRVLDLDDAAGRAALVANPTRALAVPGTEQTVAYAPHKLTGVGVTRLGTTAAISLGAYAFALARLDGR
jgi:glucokinase